MNSKTLANLTLLAGAILGSTAAADQEQNAAAADATQTTHRFEVFYDDRRIGEHRYAVVRDGAATRVRSQADFKVKLLFINAYRYEHHANELWQDGCLIRLEAVTDDNGERFAVDAAREQGQLVLTRMAPERAEVSLNSDCPATFAYWDVSLLGRDELINAQTGKALESTLTRVGTESLDGVETERYRLEAASLAAIDLWYRVSDGQWLRLETTRNDGTLSYRLAESTTEPAPAAETDSLQEPPSV
jgi:hypothetical protein